MRWIAAFFLLAVAGTAIVLIALEQGLQAVP
jgi:hypothetical protein